MRCSQTLLNNVISCSKYMYLLLLESQRTHCDVAGSCTCTYAHNSVANAANTFYSPATPLVCCGLFRNSQLVAEFIIWKFNMLYANSYVVFHNDKHLHCIFCHHNTRYCASNACIRNNTVLAVQQIGSQKIRKHTWCCHPPPFIQYIVFAMRFNLGFQENEKNNWSRLPMLPRIGGCKRLYRSSFISHF